MFLKVGIFKYKGLKAPYYLNVQTEIVNTSLRYKINTRKKMEMFLNQGDQWSPKLFTKQLLPTFSFSHSITNAIVIENAKCLKIILFLTVVLRIVLSSLNKWSTVFMLLSIIKRLYE